jgi:hypothetical protein
MWVRSNACEAVGEVKMEKDAHAAEAGVILARVLGQEYNPKYDVLEYAEAVEVHVEGIRNLPQRKKLDWTVTATKDGKTFARLETPAKEEACEYAVSLNSRYNMFEVRVRVHGPDDEELGPMSPFLHLLDREAEKRGGKKPETDECPGCGEVFGCSDSLHDHMKDCTYPKEKRMTVALEARRLNDPGWRELHSVVEETRCAVFAQEHGGEIRACRYGGIEYATRDGSVWYVDRQALIRGFLHALRRNEE